MRGFISVRDWSEDPVWLVECMIGGRKSLILVVSKNRPTPDSTPYRVELDTDDHGFNDENGLHYPSLTLSPESTKRLLDTVDNSITEGSEILEELVESYVWGVENGLSMYDD